MINLEVTVQYVAMSKALKVKRPCFHLSLAYLTQKFMDLVSNVPGGIFDVNNIATKMRI